MYNTIYPNYIGTYTGIRANQQRKQIDDEKNSQSSSKAENDANQASQGRNNTERDAYFPNGEKVSIDYTKRQIGIEQVLKDFRNTANAIGTPDEIKKEVGQYLTLIEAQAQKEAPNPQVIQSNLKTASQILDEYITKTLKKQSNVVENWVDALFLQKIDYKMKEQAPVQADIQIQENPPAEEHKQNIPEQKENNGIYVPSDVMLKRLFLQAKKYGLTDKTDQALYAFQTAMDYAEEIGDEQACALILFEQAKLYDGKNQLPQALSNYNSAIQRTTDNNIKAKAHLKMGKIYDDYIKFDPAVDHYCAAVSFSGESDNLPLQSKALSDLAQIHAERYDKKNAISFMEMSDVIAKETGNNRIKAFVSAKNAQSCETLNEKARALNYHGRAAGAFNEDEDKENLARQYQAAAKIMMSYGNYAKARNLLSKAFVAAQSTENNFLKNEISSEIAKI